jgi:hypothetical protein
MEKEYDGGIGWTGFAVEDGDAVGLDAVDGSAGHIRFLSHGLPFLDALSYWLCI